MSIQQYSLDVVKRAAVGRWIEILTHFTGVPEHFFGQENEGPCFYCGGNTKFRVYDDFTNTGGCRCNGCGNWGTGFHFIVAKVNLSWAAAINAVGEFLNCEPKKSRRSRPQSIKKIESESVVPTTCEVISRSEIRNMEHPDREALRDQLEVAKKHRIQILRDRFGDLDQAEEDLARLKREYASLHWLASELSVSVESLESLGVEYNEKTEAWHFPEFDSKREVIGVSKRLSNGEKRSVKGGKRGLSFEAGLFDRTGPIVIVEGGSDTAAGITLGLCVVGRPSAQLPNGLVPELLTIIERFDSDRRIIVLGENDKKKGGAWPGREGAEKTAALLSSELNRSIEVGFPPDGTKDLRDWLKQHPQGSADEFLLSLNLSVSQKVVEFANYDAIDNGDSETKLPIGMTELVLKFKRVFKGWPRLANGSLFVPEPEGEIRWINSTTQLIAWMSEQTTEPPKFVKSTGFVKEETLFETLQNDVQKYEAVEMFPHEPPKPSRYYAHEELPSGTGKHLETLIDRFAPATNEDKELILAFFMTLIYGGEKRPAFILTGEGQGVGKTTLCEVASELVGGLVSFSLSEDIDQIKARLLSEQALSKRIALIDNAKSRKLSSADLESLITCRTISGRANFRGERSRPNNVIWVITANGVSFSRDMAQRSVVLKLKRPQYSGTWEADTFAFVAEYRLQILADIVWWLRTDRSPLPRHGRWAGWENDVLRRLIHPSEVQQVILDRQMEIDVDRAESDSLEGFISGKLQKLGYSESSIVFIPSNILAQWMYELTGEKLTTTKCSQDVKSKIEAKLFLNLSESRTKSERGFIWSTSSISGRKVERDLAERISEDMASRRREQTVADQEARNSARWGSGTPRW